MIKLTKLRCRSCNWIGDEKSVNKVYDNVEMATLEKCPECNDAWNLEEVDVIFEGERHFMNYINGNNQ